MNINNPYRTQNGRHRSRHAQQGVAALGVTAVLLFVMALAALYANRSLLFEQKTSANQYRSTKAFEMAEAGLEWGIAALAEPRPVDSRCQPSSAGTRFRDRYAPGDGHLDYVPVITAHPACRLSDGALVCGCPAVGQVAALGDRDDPSFGLSFADVPGDPEAVQLSAQGCTGQGVACVPGSAFGRGDATARMVVTLKLHPLLRSLPTAALTAAGQVTIGANAALINHDPGSGMLVDAGGAVMLDPGSALEPPVGTPVSAAVLRHEGPLAQMGQADVEGSSVFASFFGMGKARFADAAAVRRVEGASPEARGAALMAAWAEGWRVFQLDGDTVLDALALGSADDPVLLVNRAAFTCRAACDVFGMVYVDHRDCDGLGPNAMRIHGALVARLDCRLDTTTIAYDAAILQTLRRRTGSLLRLPGSWRDF